MERSKTSIEPRHESNFSPLFPLAESFKEWLVTDQRGAFAMGTPEGVRLRKYHGFFSGVAGRRETHYLADLDIRLNGIPLWPHCYHSRHTSSEAGSRPSGESGSLAGQDAGPEGGAGFVLHPEPGREGMRFRRTPVGVEWQWKHGGGALRFSIQAHQPGGIELRWDWQGPARGKTPAELSIRPFFAQRPLHAVGGAEWRLERDRSEESSPGWRARVSGGPEGEAVYLWIRGDLRWKESPDWYYRFLYPEEARRGYSDSEDLFSGGILSAELKASASVSMILALDPHDLVPMASESEAVADGASPALDFVLTRPAGVVAGFPWFGEWGRDTFIALPGLCLAWLKDGGIPGQVRGWAFEVLARWGEWISRTGMLPNLIEKGSHQWESADATLWWTHALASLWSVSLASQGEFEGLEREFSGLLDRAIESIERGRHLFLRLAESGMLEVTEPHSTWMDARVDGASVTPRVGLLPEINALWFQARCLRSLWSAAAPDKPDFEDLERLGRQVLALHEDGRPNDLFIHSLPLAPSFVLKDWDTAARDLRVIIEEFWTPVGLRSLSPENPEYQARCVGDQRCRDRAYHQGAVWGWLGGHFEMAKDRLALHASKVLRDLEIVPPPEIFPPERRQGFPVAGHIPEIFDGEEPYTPRGAPAQAWSLACIEEARARRRLRADAKINEALARRWPDQGPAPVKRRSPRQTARKSP